MKLPPPQARRSTRHRPLPRSGRSTNGVRNAPKIIQALPFEQAHSHTRAEGVANCQVEARQMQLPGIYGGVRLHLVRPQLAHGSVAPMADERAAATTRIGDEGDLRRVILTNADAGAVNAVLGDTSQEAAAAIIVPDGTDEAGQMAQARDGIYGDGGIASREEAHEASGRVERLVETRTHDLN